MGCISVEASNRISKEVLHVAVGAGGTSLAAVALQSSVGALGGFCFGTVYSVSYICLGALTNKLLNAENLGASMETKMLATAIRVVGSCLAAWGSLTAWGLSLTLGQVIGLGILGGILTIPIALVLACLNVGDIRNEFQIAPRELNWA